MRFKDKPGEPDLGEPFRERQVVNAPLHHIGSDVHMRVVSPSDKRARGIGRNRMVGQARILSKGTDCSQSCAQSAGLSTAS